MLQKNWSELIKPTKMEVNVDENNGRIGKLIAEPLERGFGLTLGNSIRRILLSSLQGAAITSVKIKGVVHEFSTIQDVKEDVIDILLNLKQIVLKGTINEPTLARLSVSKAGVITAQDIQLLGDLSLVDERQYVATLSAPGNLEMEFLIATGQNYITNNKIYFNKNSINC